MHGLGTIVCIHFLLLPGGKCAHSLWSVVINSSTISCNYYLLDRMRLATEANVFASTLGNLLCCQVVTKCGEK